MSIPESNNLFRGSGPQETLDYFLSRLKSGDLSSEEALAMLGAVHAELGKGGSGDPKVYQAYSNAMESLQRSLPDIYDYVVTAWEARNSPVSATQDNREPAIEGSETGQQKSESLLTQTQDGFREIKTSGGELGETDDPEEAGEVEEEESSPSDKIEEQEKQSDQEVKENEADRDADEEGVEHKEDKPEEIEESNQETRDESVEETEVNDAHNEEQEPSGAEPSNEENEPEANEESTAEGAANEPEGGSESSESGGEKAGQAEQTEWPEIEQSETEEPLDGIEGQASPAPPED